MRKEEDRGMYMKKRIMLIFLMLISITFLLSAQGSVLNSSLSLKLLPTLDIPIGNSTEYYKIGGSGVLSAAYKPPLSLPLYFSADLGYSLLPFNLEESKNLNILSFGAGIGAGFQFLRRLAAYLYAKGGYYYGFTQDELGDRVGGGNPFPIAVVEKFSPKKSTRDKY